MRRTDRRLCRSGAIVLGCVLAALPAWPGMTVGFDTDTLNEVLPALTATEIQVSLSETNTIGVVLEEMRVTGLQPGGSDGEPGHILTSMRIRVPQLGLDLPVDSKLSLHLSRQPAGNVLELRFDEVEIPLPLAGKLDIASFLPPLEFSADNLFRVAGAGGDIHIRSTLIAIEMGIKVLRFEFDLSARPGGAD